MLPKFCFKETTERDKREGCEAPRRAEWESPRTYRERYARQTHDFVRGLLLSGKVRLREVPLYVRAELPMYWTAFRVSRTNYDLLIENLQVLMADIEALPRHYKGSYGAGTDVIKEMLNELEFNMYAHNFRGTMEFEAFEETFYEPFRRRIQKRIEGA